MALIDNLPRLIFCLTPGRSGTRYLAAWLDAIPGVHAAHEPKPDFVEVARAARRDPTEAARFWRCEKLPYIASLDCDTYVETSHLFGKGFVKPLLDMGVVPDVIVLRRNARDVALSRWRRGSIPARTPNGQRYLLHPERAEHCPLPRWWAMTDYQLCYWYTLEMEARIQERVRRIKEAGGNVAFLDFFELTRGGDLWAVDFGLELPPLPDLAAYRNQTPAQYRDLMPRGDLDKQERQVRDAIESAGDVKPDPRKKIDVVVLSMETIHKQLAISLLSASHDTRYNIAVSFMAANPTSNTRCHISREFVDNERRADYVMMIDEDTVPHGDFLGWCESDYDVLSFVTPCWQAGTSPESPVVWNVQLDHEVEKFVPATSKILYQLSKEYDAIDVASAGTGAILIKREVLEHPDLRAPFLDIFNKYGIRTTGHDLNFCHRARAAGFKVGSVLQNPSSHFKEIDLLQVARLIGSMQHDN